MIRKRGFRTYEEAAKEAEALLWKNRKSEGELHTIEHTRKDSEGKLLFAYIEDKDTGATAYICSLTENGYNLTFLSGDEAKESNRTYPFRDVPKESIPFLMAIHTPIFKPVKEITPDEALTPEGLRAIYAFFGYDTQEDTIDVAFTPIEEIRDLSIDEAFELWEDEDGKGEIGSLLTRPFPQELTERTGIAVKTPSDYARALAKLMGVKMSREQTKQTEENFLFYASETFLRYAIYEFFRTEDYSHLKGVLSHYANFALPEKWEQGFTLFYDYRNVAERELFTTEEYVLAKYLSKWDADIVSEQSRIKEIAKYTGTPLSLMGKAYKIKHIWDF